MSAAPQSRVVIVDDTADLRELLTLALTRGGFDVVGEAADGRQGVEVVTALRPDVVLLDLAMPVMDGLEALPLIRAVCPDATVVVLSGFGADQVAARAIAAGADGYVQKGAPLREILASVRELCARRSDTVPSVAPAVPPADVPAAPEPPAGDWPAATTDLAPYGVLKVGDSPDLVVLRANARATRLLHDDVVGRPLGAAAAGLAQLVAYHRLDTEATFEVDLAGVPVRASVRRSDGVLLVYLDPGIEDVGLLRRAVATMAHEIRGPVTVICGVAETMGSHAAEMDPAQRERFLGSVARQARILDTITADLLTAAQIQRGTLRVDLQDVDPRAVIQGAVADRYEVGIEVQDTRSVRADPLRFEQMLTNLLSNAHKYGAPPFRVRVRPEGPLVCIDVVDHGEGVPPDFRGRLFEEFARADGATATGTGLGLYVVRTLALAQQGEVVHAAGEPRGAVFTIKLRAS